jgi:hypothetical protein
MRPNNQTHHPLTAEEMDELRSFADAGIRSVSKMSLEEFEKLGGPLSETMILVFAAIGAARKHAAEE